MNTGVSTTPWASSSRPRRAALRAAFTRSGVSGSSRMRLPVALANAFTIAATAGLPPAHVGLHAGPVLFQQGALFSALSFVLGVLVGYVMYGDDPNDTPR